ncbi:GGDEF domain-containing protein [Roseomonas terrae]|jgi:diguanylate cyclase (GGDEF)-like protein|uniref:diguanylate cyclase n=1 Tax=Neoroseomonas terrae TaxID=424799 RepID=A0ABS5ENQ4_9PROT|nr:GGDEF domain-containing protein [Neoroseomonas terrae]MBR0652664.1 GGDEF domain-containing protein [Neoroseomonas terrae]
MDWEIPLHVALRSVTAILAIIAFGYGVARAVSVRGDGWRRGLRALGAPLLLGVVVLSVLDLATVLTQLEVPEDTVLEWIWTALDVLVPAFLLLQMETWRRYDRLQAELAMLSETDPLTGLPNRRGFLARAEPAVAAARRDGRACAVAMLDLDRFKAINDGFGHPAGDAVLRGAALTIAQAVRASDVTARLGGEEFALLLPGDDPAGAARLVERLRAAVAAGVAHPAGAGQRVTFSAGIAALGPGGGEAALEAALSAADQALYAAKAAGRDRVMIG